VAAGNKETLKQINKPFIELQAKEFLSGKEICQLFGISQTTLWGPINKHNINTNLN